MSRIAPQLAAVAFAALLGALMLGSPILSVAFLAPTLALTWWSWHVRRHDPSDHPWSAPTTTRSTSASSTRATGRPPTRRVVMALGHVEARQLALSPWFGIGVGFCVVMVLSFASSYDGGETWAEVVPDLPFLAHALVGMVVLASHRTATRAERDGATELFGSCPTTAAVRTEGVLAAAPVPMVTLALFSAAYLAVAGTSSGVAGALSAAAVPTILGVMLLGAGGVALGVALGRWYRSPLAPIAAVVAIGFASPRLASGPAGELSGRMLLSTMPGFSDHSPAPSWGQAWLHVAWLTVITTVVALVAVCGRPRDRAQNADAAPREREPAGAGARSWS
ncbi:MAG: hypothetical protein ACSLFP_10750 [Acidimicrobiales bacterium]